MRLAFITSLLPSKTLDTGFEIANACVLQTLKEANIEVVQFGFLRNTDEGTGSDSQIVLDRIVIENAVAGRGQKLSWLASSVLRGLPVISTKLSLFGEDKLMRILEQHGPFDGYIVNSAPVAGAFPRLMKQKPSVLLAHNVEYKSAEENARTAGGVTGLLYARESRLLARVEKAALQDCRFVWCLSEEDRQDFGATISHKSAVLPLLIPNQRISPQTPLTHDVGLIGTWTWQPNFVGLQWFIEEVAPRLPADISIAIAGRLPQDFQVRLANIKVLGRVADADVFVASSRMIALASRTGTGIQLKTIETLQAGKPAVATPSSVRGVGDLPETCLVADQADAFAAGIVKMVGDIRSGKISTKDSQSFVDERKQGLRKAVQAGLEALGTRTHTAFLP